MAKFKVDISALRTDERQLDKQIQELQELNKRLETLLGRIESSWEGDASTTYIRMMRNYAAQASNMEEVLKEFKSYVNTAAETFEDFDKKTASRIWGSF